MGRWSSPDTETLFSQRLFVWLPVSVLFGLVASVCLAFEAPMAATITLLVFVVGIYPQAKMKRADLLTQLQKEFNELAANKDALLSTRNTGAHAFYLKFWNLQHHEFALWRSGMIASDTYAHWLAKRLASFREGNTERYWQTSPYAGWCDVRAEYLGTDFRCFIDAAEIACKAALDPEWRKHSAADPAGTAAPPAWTDARLIELYAALRPRIERLMMEAGGGAVRGSFLFRWFGPTKIDLVRKTATVLASSCNKSAWWARAWWLHYFLILAIPSTCVLAGYLSRPWAQRITGEHSQPTQILIGNGPPSKNGGMLVVDRSERMLTFVIEFPEEGACGPGTDGHRWTGTTLTRHHHGLLRQLGAQLRACHSAARPVVVEVRGFASTSELNPSTACGSDVTDAGRANMKLANLRMENVAEFLHEHAGDADVRRKTWRTPQEMQRELGFVDRIVGGAYSSDRGALNRRAEIRLLQLGTCEADGGDVKM